MAYVMDFVAFGHLVGDLLHTKLAFCQRLVEARCGVIVECAPALLVTTLVWLVVGGFPFRALVHLPYIA